MSTKIKFFLGALVVAAFAVTASAGAQTYTFSGTLKQGSKGVSVWNLQKFLNMCPTTQVSVAGAGSLGMETQTFGPATKAAVIRFQAANGLAADGIFGAMSAAKAMALQASGNPCGGSVVVVPPAGLPAGCTSTSGFSPLTGQSCAGGSTSTPSSTSLSGTDGIISDVTKVSSYNNEKVGEGENAVKVAGLDVKASNDGDIALKSIKVEFSYQNSGSNRLNRYIDGVSVWEGSTKVGSADVEDFNKDSSGVYSKTITLDNAVVRSDKTERFYISVDAASSFDSTDINATTDWNVTTDSIRFVDGSGVVTTDSTTGDLASNGTQTGINFVTFQSAADIELRASKDSDSPVAGIVVVDDQDSTDNVVLLKGSLKLKGDSDVTINELPVTFTVAGGDNLNEVASNLTLVLDGNEYSESVASTYGTASVTFDNLDFNMNAGDTVDFEVKADINGTSDYTEGDTITASFTSDNSSAADIEDQQGDQLADSDKTGTAVGDAQEFRSQGISVALVSTDESSNSDATLGTYTIKFKVTAVGDDAYIGTTSSTYDYALEEASAGATTSGFSAAITNNGGSGNSTTTTTGNNWKINDGTSVTLTLQVFGQGSNLSAGAWRTALNGIYWAADDSNAVTTSDSEYTSNMDDFHTGYEQLI